MPYKSQYEAGEHDGNHYDAHKVSVALTHFASKLRLCGGSQCESRRLFRLVDGPARQRLSGRWIDGPLQQAFGGNSTGFTGLRFGCRLQGHYLLPVREWAGLVAVLLLRADSICGFMS